MTYNLNRDGGLHIHVILMQTMLDHNLSVNLPRKSALPNKAPDAMLRWSLNKIRFTGQKKKWNALNKYH